MLEWQGPLIGASPSLAENIKITHMSPLILTSLILKQQITDISIDETAKEVERTYIYLHGFNSWPSIACAQT